MRDQSEQVAERVRQLLRDRADLLPDEPVDDEGPTPAAGGSWRDRVARASARLPVRVDPGRGAALAVGLAVLLAALVTGGWVLLQRPATVPVSASAPSGIAGVTATPVGSGGPSAAGGRSSGPLSSAARSGPASATEVVVDVAGKVHRPGLYRLPPGSRIDDAVRAAGGPLHGVDLSSLNLAQPLADGQQIAVGVPAAPATPAPTGQAGSAGTAPGSGGTTGAPVDLNSATLDQLETLPGVGPVLGQHILDWRTEHGSFASVDQLDDVTGIGTVKFAALKSLVTV